MTTKIATVEVLDAEDEREVGMTTLEAQTRGEIDVQVVTAKRYPRSLVTFKKAAMEMATLDEETAESCLYALPRGSRTIDGPSARLSEIIASAYGHMRIEGRVVSTDDKFVTARGVAWDLQNNVAIAVEVKRRITDSKGARYNDDMIGTTSNAAISIATRNATLKNIPKAYWQPIYLACRQIVAGDATTLASRREAMLAHFLKLGVQNGSIFEAIGVKGVEDITLDHLVTLKGVAAAIKNGEVTVEGAFSKVDVGPKADPLQEYVSELSDEDRQGVQALLAAKKLNKAQIAALLKKYPNNPKGLMVELMTPAEKTPEVAKPDTSGLKSGADLLKEQQSQAPAVDVPKVVAPDRDAF